MRKKKDLRKLYVLIVCKILPTKTFADVIKTFVCRQRKKKNVCVIIEKMLVDQMVKDASNGHVHLYESCVLQII